MREYQPQFFGILNIFREFDMLGLVSVQIKMYNNVYKTFNNQGH